MSYIECSTCHNSRFEARQKSVEGIIVDGENKSIDSIKNSSNSFDPYGPYKCTQCGREEDELERFRNEPGTVYDFFTLEEQEEYLKNNGLRCPGSNCKETNIECSDADIDGPIA